MTSPLTRPVCVPCVCADVASRSQTLAVQSADPVTANLHGRTCPAISKVLNPPVTLQTSYASSNKAEVTGDATYTSYVGQLPACHARWPRGGPPAPTCHDNRSDFARVALQHIQAAALDHVPYHCQLVSRRSDGPLAAVCDGTICQPASMSCANTRQMSLGCNRRFTWRQVSLPHDW